MTREDAEERRRVRLAYLRAIAEDDEELRQWAKERLVEFQRRDMEESNVDAGN